MLAALAVQQETDSLVFPKHTGEHIEGAPPANTTSQNQETANRKPNRTWTLPREAPHEPAPPENLDEHDGPDATSAALCIARHSPGKRLGRADHRLPRHCGPGKTTHLVHILPRANDDDGDGLQIGARRCSHALQTETQKRRLQADDKVDNPRSACKPGNHWADKDLDKQAAAGQ